MGDESGEASEGTGDEGHGKLRWYHKGAAGDKPILAHRYYSTNVLFYKGDFYV